MSEKTTIPCEHLLADESNCAIGRNFPTDCASCAAYQPCVADSERQTVEVWSRVMGYHRPVSAYNAGKQQEHRERKMFVEAKAQCS